MVDSDPVLLTRILAELLDNAIKYTEKGDVLVGCRRSGADWLVEIRDSGPGLSPADMDNIFEDFFQVGNASRDARKGFGLGLARRTARLLGHDLRVGSLPGRGSLFQLTLAAVSRETRSVAAE